MKRLLLALLLALVILWGAWVIAVDGVWARMPRPVIEPCGWTARTGIASHVGYWYPWRETAELRESWGELPPDFDLGGEWWRGVALNEVFRDRWLIGRTVWLWSPVTRDFERGIVLDAMAATHVVADIDPVMARKLNAGVLAGGTQVTVLIPRC